MLDWLEEAELDRVGCFRYSPVEGAAANALPDPVPDEVKEERWHRFMQAQQKISARRLAARVGQRMRVLVDSIEATSPSRAAKPMRPRSTASCASAGAAPAAAGRRIRGRHRHRGIRVRPRGEDRAMIVVPTTLRALRARHHDPRGRCDRECRERDAARRRGRGRRDPSRGGAGAARRMPAARRLRDRRCEDHFGLPAAGAPRDPHGRAGLARRRPQRAGTAGSCYRRSLEIAEAQDRSRPSRFPAISTGVYGYPGEAGARIAVATVREFVDVREAPARSDLLLLFGGGPRGVRGAAARMIEGDSAADPRCAARAAALAGGERRGRDVRDLLRPSR